MDPDTEFFLRSFGSNSKLKLELLKLKRIAPKRKKKHRSAVSYADVVWFLLDHWKNTEQTHKKI